MKIAVATENGHVSGHFGKCEQFTVFETAGNQVVGKAVLDTKAHGHGMLPPFLASNGVETVIAGGMGEGARHNLNTFGIRIVAGATGQVDEAVQKFLEGTLKVSDSGCHGHGHDEQHQCNCHGHKE